MTFDRQALADQAASLAAQGVYIGTSSWKYPGWCGMLYDRSRYEWRGKFAESRFKRDCLAEYAEVFKTVCVDAAYYTFPSQQYLDFDGGQQLGRAAVHGSATPTRSIIKMNAGGRPGVPVAGSAARIGIPILQQINQWRNEEIRLGSSTLALTLCKSCESCGSVSSNIIHRVASRPGMADLRLDPARVSTRRPPAQRRSPQERFRTRSTQRV